MTLTLRRRLYGQRFALDRGSIRRIDSDGHLHVALNPISKSNICPYMAEEIPGADELGLRPGKIYQLYRDPDELRKAARTFDGKPLLIVHRPQSADDHSREVTVGAIKNPVWDAPYLKAELDVWDGEAIAGIHGGDRRELSAGYRYRADMTPGQIGGVRYDGVMRDIVANHVALVPTGRAGSDVMVGDIMPSRPDYAAIVADAVRQVDREDAARMPKAGKPPIRSSDMASNDDNDATPRSAK